VQHCFAYQRVEGGGRGSKISQICPISFINNPQSILFFQIFIIKFTMSKICFLLVATILTACIMSIQAGKKGFNFFFLSGGHL
jgi:hypothetical protein